MERSGNETEDEISLFYLMYLAYFIVFHSFRLRNDKICDVLKKKRWTKDHVIKLNIRKMELVVIETSKNLK